MRNLYKDFKNGFVCLDENIQAILVIAFVVIICSVLVFGGVALVFYIPNLFYSILFCTFVYSIYWCVSKVHEAIQLGKENNE